ncbi:hypothetical protein C2W64_03620 [Brevibacillus laterosporus]|nr:hypothetical protein C2W64_03620 [Brevibacillus laterosporus]
MPILGGCINHYRGGGYYEESGDFELYKNSRFAISMKENQLFFALPIA